MAAPIPFSRLYRTELGLAQGIARASPAPAPRCRCSICSWTRPFGGWNGGTARGAWTVGPDATFPVRRGDGPRRCQRRRSGGSPCHGSLRARCGSERTISRLASPRRKLRIARTSVRQGHVAETERGTALAFSTSSGGSFRLDLVMSQADADRALAALHLGPESKRVTMRAPRLGRSAAGLRRCRHPAFRAPGDHVDLGHHPVPLGRQTRRCPPRCSPWSLGLMVLFAPAHRARRAHAGRLRWPRHPPPPAAALHPARAHLLGVRLEEHAGDRPHPPRWRDGAPDDRRRGRSGDRGAPANPAGGDSGRGHEGWGCDGCARSSGEERRDLAVVAAGTGPPRPGGLPAGGSVGRDAGRGAGATGRGREATDRGSAAFALKASGDERAAARIRAAAESVAGEDARAALEAIASEEAVSEEVVRRLGGKS